jgi:ComF family protein
MFNVGRSLFGGRLPKQPAMSTIVKKLYKIVGETVFPPQCLVCRTFIRPPGGDCNGFPGQADLSLTVQIQVKRLLSQYLCRNCIGGLVAVESPLCSCCGVPFESRQGIDHRCGDCSASPKKFRIARAPLVYEQIFTEVIHCYKYKGKIQLARPLAELLLTAFRLFWDKDSIDVVVPVPLHLKKLRRRGFNQVYLLIRNWQAIAGQMPLDLGNLQIERDVIVRNVPTVPQTGLGRRHRAENIKDVFELVDETKIVDKRILLVDDVYTTGATVDECARLLLRHGAAHVDVLSLARAV